MSSMTRYSPAWASIPTIGDVLWPGTIPAGQRPTTAGVPTLTTSFNRDDVLTPHSMQAAAGGADDRLGPSAFGC